VILAVTTIALSTGAAPAGSRPSPAHAPRKGNGVALSDGTLRDIVGALRSGRRATAAADASVPVVGDGVTIEVLHSLSTSAARARIVGLGGTVTGSVAGLVEARVPYDRLEMLEAQPGIDQLQTPARANAPVATTTLSGTFGASAVTKVGAAAWHSMGFRGTGTKVGIVDYFDKPTWDAAVAAKELPPPAATFCRIFGSTCDVWGSEELHGEGVAEIVHDIAPGARLYLATVFTTSDLQKAVNWFVANGVKVVTRSLTSEYDGPGNGTGPLASVIANAVARGITWFNSAGNAAGSPGHGSYWRGSWEDPDADGLLNFNGGDEFLKFQCAFSNGVRWNDWGGNRTDYDVYVYDTAGAILEDASERFQTGPNPAAPIEFVRPDCDTFSDYDYLVIFLNEPGGGTDLDVIEFMVNGGEVEGSTNPYSSSGPAADTKSPGALAVGAVDPALGNQIASYSSRGPSNDNRVKPDISAAACISSFAYSLFGCFNGTSSASPTAAGVAALARARWPAWRPADVKTWMLTRAVVSRGAPGPDNVYGHGEVRLPPPNNALADTRVLTGTGGNVIVSNILATRETGEPLHSGAQGNKSIWFKWKAPRSGPVSMSTVGSSFDTLLGVYTGTQVNALSKVASNNDLSPTNDASRVQFVGLAGRTYRIAVDGYQGQSGRVVFAWQG
jgi:hypothetical protein